MQADPSELTCTTPGPATAEATKLPQTNIFIREAVNIQSERYQKYKLLVEHFSPPLRWHLLNLR